MSRFKRFFLLASTMLALAACVAGAGQYPIATLRDGVFRHVTYDYAVESTGSSGQLMGDDWRLDNYVAAATGLGEPKRTTDYMSDISLDHDGDGVSDERLSIPTYDLLFKHRRNDGLIFVSTFPISQHHSERELAVMLRDYVESASHAGRIRHNYQEGTSRTSAQMASRILTSRPVSVDGFPAHEVIFEVANVQQLELTPSARWERGHVVLVRTDLVFNDAQFRERTRSSAYGRTFVGGHFYPILMVIGYSNHPDDYDAHQADFRALLNRVRIGGNLDHEMLRERASECGVEQLDLVISGDRVSHTSLMAGTEEWNCLGRHAVDARFPTASWVRTLSLRRERLRGSERVTTAGQPPSVEDLPPSPTPSTAGGENPVSPEAVAPVTTDSTGAAPAGI